MGRERLEPAKYLLEPAVNNAKVFSESFRIALQQLKTTLRSKSENEARFGTDLVKRSEKLLRQFEKMSGNAEVMKGIRDSYGHVHEMHPRPAPLTADAATFEMYWQQMRGLMEEIRWECQRLLKSKIE